MGNIEIRDQSSLKRRTHIFSDRKSFDAARSEFRNSLTQRYDRSNYSPIRFSKGADHPKQLPLTERKPATNRYTNQDSLAYSPILNQESVDNVKHAREKSHFLKANNSKIRNIEIQSNHEQQNGLSASQKTGKIVSNSNKRVLEERRNFQTFQLLMNQERPLDSPFGTKEIIKKVRNFNDFLNEIKRKLKEDKQETLLRNKSRLEEFKKQQEEDNSILSQKNKLESSVSDKQAGQTQPHTIEKSRSMRRIEIALKLQNQKLELQKYRKLVERELSKTHSIENISLCTKNSGQKILTIQYESILQQKMMEKQGERGGFVKEPSEKTLINKIYEQDAISDRLKELEEKERELSQKYSQPSYDIPVKLDKPESELLKRLKLQYERMLQNVLELGKTIERYERQGITDNGMENDKILIVQGRESSKRASQYSRRESQFSKRESQFYKKGSEFKESFVERVQSQFNKAGSQISKRSSKEGVLNKEEKQTDNDFRRVQSQKSQVESQRGRKESQCSKAGDQDQASKKSSPQNIQLIEIQTQQPPTTQNLQHTFNNQTNTMLKLQNLTQRKDSKQKIERIESLFERLNDLQEEYQETDREIREAIAGESLEEVTVEEEGASLG